MNSPAQPPTSGSPGHDVGLRRPSRGWYNPKRPGEVPEWLNGAVSKTVVVRMGHRGFESHPLRQLVFGSHSAGARQPLRSEASNRFEFSLKFDLALARH